jgi:hypothetical protein
MRQQLTSRGRGRGLGFSRSPLSQGLLRWAASTASAVAATNGGNSRKQRRPTARASAGAGPRIVRSSGGAAKWPPSTKKNRSAMRPQPHNQSTRPGSVWAAASAIPSAIPSVTGP